MAKEEKKKEKNEEVHEPAKPPRSKGEINLFMVLGIIGGAVILIFALMVVGYMFIIKPDIQAIQSPADSAAQSEKHGDEHGNEAHGTAVSHEEDQLLEDPHELEKQIHFVKTEQIVTNPKGASSMFIIVELGIEFRMKPDEEGDGGGHGGGGDEITADSPFLKIPMARTKAEVSKILGSMTAQELQTIDRDTLRMEIKEAIAPAFNKQGKMYLRDVIFTQYVLQ